MGHNIRFRKINDALRHAADIVITCRNRHCGHEVVIDFETIAAILREFRVNDELSVVGRALRCHRCGFRQPKINMTMKGDSRTLALRDGDALPPRGIALAIWLKAHSSEKKAAPSEGARMRQLGSYRKCPTLDRVVGTPSRTVIASPCR